MEFEDALESIAERLKEYDGTLDTEEATKNALIMPFISQVLGYDVFNPKEVVPEFTADIGTKKGEKIDYAIMRDGVVQMLIECKSFKSPLTVNNAGQLFRYFHTSNARIGVLTNGEVWEFFTDLDRPNKMDEKPFLVLNLRKLDSYLVVEVKKLTKDAFDLDSVLTSAEELKYVSAMKRILSDLFEEPTEEFVRLLASQVIEGSFTVKRREMFTPLVRKATAQFANDLINTRLRTALQGQQSVVTPPIPVEEPGPQGTQRASASASEDGVVTTEAEMEAFQIVRAIVASEVDWQRVFYRDAKSYFAVLLDNNNRKPICRFHFNHKQHYLGLLDENKVETKIPISVPGDIYVHTEGLRTAVKRYA